jgi:conjugation system TraG family ATPase
MRNILPVSTLENRSPIYKVEHGCIASKHGDITACFRVTLPELFTLTGEDYAQLHSAWVKAIKVLPDYSVVHKQDWYVKDTYRGECRGDLPGFLEKSFARHFNERPFLSHRCYLFLTKTCRENLRKQSLQTTLSRGQLVPKDMLSEESVGKFMDSVGLFANIMSSSGYVKLSRLGDDDIVGTRERAGLLDMYFSLSTDEKRCLRDIQLNPDCVAVGDKLLCLHALSDTEALPMEVSSDKKFGGLSTDASECRLGFAAPVGLLLPCSHIYNQYVFVGDSAENLRRLEASAKRMQSLRKFSRSNEANGESIVEYLEAAARGDMRSVKAHFNVTAWTDHRDYAALKALKDAVSTRFTDMDCQAREEATSLPALFWAGVPGNAADFPSEDSWYTFIEPAVCFFAQETMYLDSLSPFGIMLTDRFSGRPVHVDISDEPRRRGLINNRNKFVLGSSGSGKSFFMNHMLRQYYEQGTHVVLVDVGHSYLGLCELINRSTCGRDGVYFTYTEGNPIAFNPFYAEDGQFDVEKKSSLHTLFMLLWKKKSEEPKRGEDVGLSDAINLYIKKIRSDKGVTPSFNTFYEFLGGEYREEVTRRKVDKDHFDLDNLLYVLSPYYRGGEYDYLLNSDKQLDLLGKRFVVFELDNIKDHKILFPVVTIIIMEAFLSKLRKLKGIRKMIVIEEAWKAIANEGMAEYMRYLLKTVRKHFGEAVVVTQEVEDILGSPIVKEAIVKESDCKIILDLSKFRHSFEQIRAMLGFTDKQKAQVLSLNRNNDVRRPPYREVYIDLGGAYSAVYAVEVSREEYLTYTTEEREKKEALDMAERCGGDVELAIRELVSREAEKGRAGEEVEPRESS